MSMEEFEAQMLCMGYNEKQIADAKERIQEWANSMVIAIEEVIAKFRDFIASIWEDVKETLNELAERIREALDIESPDTKNIKPLSKRLQYVNANRVVNRVVQRYYMDVRMANKKFTRYYRRG